MRKRFAMDAAKERSRRERRISEISREIDWLVDGIAKRLGDPHIIFGRMKLLVRERSELTAELETAPAAGNVVALHPATLARYEQQLARLRPALGKGALDGDSEGAEAIRDLLETVRVDRDPSRPGGVEVEIAGCLTALLSKAAFPNRVKGVW
jgi:site-specific DNA recombinase